MFCEVHHDRKKGCSYKKKKKRLVVKLKKDDDETKYKIAKNKGIK